MRDCGPIPLGPGWLLWLEAWRWRVIRKAGDWRRGRVRIIQWGTAPNWSTYIRITPSFGMGMAWFNRKEPPRSRRLRLAYHHGVQMVEWYGCRWVVTKQILGKSRVNRESLDLNGEY